MKNYATSHLFSKSKIYFLAVFLALGSLLLFGYYFYQVALLTKSGYSFKSYQRQLDDYLVMDSYEKKAFSEEFSLISIEEKIALMDFVKIEKVQYVPILKDLIAKSR